MYMYFSTPISSSQYYLIPVSDKKHLAAAKHISEYLIGTQYYAVCAMAL
jgi:hypothetical protein